MERRSFLPKKHIFLAAAVASALAMGAVVAAATSSAQEPAHQAKAAGLTLTVWEGPGIPDAVKTLYDRYEKTSGNTLEIQTIPDPWEQNLLAKWAAGDRPDIMFFHAAGSWLVQLNPSKNLIDLSNQPFVKRTLPGLLRSASLSGKVYGAVRSYPNIFGVLFNVPIFRKYHLTPPRNYADVVSICQTLQKKAPSVAPIFTAGGDQWPLQILPYTMLSDTLVKDPKLPQKLNTNKAHFTDGTFVFAYQALKALVKKGCYNKNILTAKFEDEGKAMLSDKAAMEFQLSGIVQPLIDANGVKNVNKHIGFTCVSRSTRVCSSASAGAWYTPKTGKTTREQAATAFLNWALGAGYAAYLSDSGQLPILKGYKPPAGAANVFAQADELARRASAQVIYEPLLATWGPFEKYLQEMVAGKLSPYQVGKALQANFAQNARLQGLPGF